MLHKLLMREWILTRRALLTIAGIYLAFEAYFVCRTSSARQYLIFAAIYASFLTLTLFLREDKFRAASWSCTLPISRRDLVRARFLGAWILVMGNLALALVLARIMPGRAVQAAAVLDPATLFLAAFAVTIVLALMLPFAIRFGLLGVMIFLVGTQLLGTTVLLIAVRTRGRARASKGMLAGGIEVLTEALVALRDFLSPPIFYLAAAVVLIIVNWLGYRLAVAMFRRLEL
jgi:hypothetical protein